MKNRPFRMVTNITETSIVVDGYLIDKVAIDNVVKLAELDGHQKGQFLILMECCFNALFNPVRRQDLTVEAIIGVLEDMKNKKVYYWAGFAEGAQDIG